MGQELVQEDITSGHRFMPIPDEAGYVNLNFIHELRIAKSGDSKSPSINMTSIPISARSNPGMMPHTISYKSEHCLLLMRR